ncbi:MAG: hypothetical protein K8F34_08540 [Candidatus Kuenenia stuttgartiensis]|jgi:hypothetical protein|uniref:hypothetical protein n=1 Tax=Candidatus Kuenenia TaxID=380738 RepID=UPI0003180E0E|nr:MULTISPECIES: hypothetical protein [Kuenenia]MBE7546020.1 hypothetical protein [Planctomycetia bacterium]MBZ0191727.1 hypothetical protein [Candidatus Kuenenia stuttgartiensis]MCZ7623048.1 hypothetical protein [Candidatus Kuenenia sp.]
MESDDNAVINGIRQNTKTGRPCGGKSFIKKEINGIIKGKTAKEKINGCHPYYSLISIGV